ncbi:NADP-dependent oxidoreductase domain-containing protein [Armillaria luteobubalina]|uniref:NADP-dependent oxidoreductase domain-containing protein n=1 Tax=Armillaria luteobubalina TaxID=153913 RepID=A0AA39QF05_9AGAR|nr:NADP-dependent oxidoreductase domain-containing protein [Armillaria luteobubalina]
MAGPVRSLGNITGGMSAVTFGASELKVSKIILGCPLYGDPDWLSQVQNEEESIKQVKTAYDAGINTFDTSNSEVVLGKAIKQEILPRDGITVMTKVFHPVSLSIDGLVDGKATEYADTHRYANQYSLAREDIFDSIKKCLERLQLDYIDVLYCQEYDASTPTHETLYMMQFKQGESDMWECQTAVPGNNDYNLLYHQDEHEMMPTLKYLDVSFLPLNSLVHGAMTMPLDQQLALPSDNLVPGGRKKWHNTIITRLEEIALKKNITMTQVAVAWSMSKERVRALIISGPSTVQLLDAVHTPYVGGVDVLLTPADINYLEESYVPQKLRY